MTTLERATLESLNGLLGHELPEQRRVIKSLSSSSLSTADLSMEEWDGEIFCGGHSAEDRAKWLVENQALSLDAARLRVMAEFPTPFGNLSRSSCSSEDLDEHFEHAPAFQTSFSADSLVTTSLTNWDSEEFCDGHSAGDRARWVVENSDLSLQDARLCVMQEFPTHFAPLLPARKRSCSGSSCSTVGPDGWDNEEFGVGAATAEGTARQATGSVGLALRRTRLRVMQEFASQHGHSEQSCAPAAPAPRDLTRQVPRVVDFAEEFSKVCIGAPPTTLMLRNIPNRYTQQQLIEELEVAGFKDSFDFLYAPAEIGRRGNVGYAFVNFVNPDWAVHCQEELEGYDFKKHQQKTHRKFAVVSVAHLQGLEANLRHYERSVSGRARSKGYGPVILKGTENVPDW